MALTTLHTTANYEGELIAFIEKNEAFHSKVYLDSKGVATIGYGYALNGTIATISADFAKIGIVLSPSQRKSLDDWAKNNGIASQSEIDTFNASTNAITLTQTQGDNLLLAIKGQYEDIVKKKLGTELYNAMANTKELIVLVDMAYKK